MAQFVSANYSPETKKVKSERRCIRIGNDALPSEPNGNQNHTMEGISIFQAVQTVCRMLNTQMQILNTILSTVILILAVETIKGKALHSEHPLLVQIRRGKRKLIEMKQRLSETAASAANLKSALITINGNIQSHGAEVMFKSATSAGAYIWVRCYKKGKIRTSIL